MKPYDSNVIKLMAEHSDECAAYASAMKWDWLRRQKVEDVSEEEIQNNSSCGFCVRLESKGYKTKYENCSHKCQLALAGQHCGDSRYYRRASIAHKNNDQQAFTENANNLYYKILSIIDDFYKPEPKKEEVFYKRGDKFDYKGTVYQLVYANGMYLVNTEDGGWYHCPHNNDVKNVLKITEAEFRNITGSDFGDFTLIESKKED